MFSRILIAAVALGAAVVSLWLCRRWLGSARRAARTLRLLRRSQRVGLASLGPGPAAVRGRIAPFDLVASAHSGRQGVYLSSTLEVWDRTPNVLGHGGKWVPTEHLEEAAPFEITDGDAAVPVDPRGGEFPLPLTTRPHAADGSSRFTEALLAPGDEVIACGTLEPQGGFAANAAYRGTTIRQVLARGSAGLTVSLASRTLRRLVLQLALGALGLIGAVTVVSLALFVTGNTFPLIRVTLPGTPVMRQSLPERYVNHLSCRTDDELAGELRAEAWVLGWLKESRLEHRLGDRLREELWARQLCRSWEDLQVERRRRYLLFEVLSYQGKARRRPGFWDVYCGLHPDHCPP